MKDATAFPREKELHELLVRADIRTPLWEIMGVRNTGIRRITAYFWPAAKCVVIVQEFGKVVRRGRPWSDIDGWEIFIPASRSNVIIDIEAELLNYLTRTPAESTVSPRYNGA